MKFLDKLKAVLTKFMQGRYGFDQLGRTLLFSYLILFLLSAVTGWRLLYLLSIAALLWAIVRMLSRNTQKRREENAKYLSLQDKVLRESSQFIARVKGSREYKYFKCPKCGRRMRLHRKVGAVTVHCRECGHSFDMKA